MKKKLLIFISIIVVAIVVNLYISSNRVCCAATDSQLVINYITANISELSPVKEQLGGTFYVTNIKAENNGGVVEYEDGHNAYTADFAYTLDEKRKVSITMFNVRE